jgi:hypothetical protein
MRCQMLNDQRYKLRAAIEDELDRHHRALFWIDVKCYIMLLVPVILLLTTFIINN